MVKGPLRGAADLREERLPMRSSLFVPGDSARKQARAFHSDADVLILDLEDSVALQAKPEARERVAAFLVEARRRVPRPLLHVRVNAFDSGLIEADLDAIVPAAPDGIMLPKSRDGAQVTELDVRLRALEAEVGLDDGAIRIIPIATETAAALFTLGSYEGASPRLSALAWGSEDLAAALGAETYRDETGGYTDPFRLARSLVLAAARAARVEPIDTVYTDLQSVEGLRHEALAARRDGFTGKLAIHPAQVPIINEVFTPSAEAVSLARRVVDAFEQAPGAGVISLDGKMVDRPHLAQAQALLTRARLFGG
jgi:citrate lyase subunit beta/citryl-CoA lyase